MRRHLERLHGDERGATATEYIILLILVACFIIMIVQTYGETLSDKFYQANLKVSDDVEF